MKKKDKDTIFFFHLLNGYTGSPNVLKNIISCLYKSPSQLKLFYGGLEKGSLDKVNVEMTPYDLTKGRITFRHK